MSTTAELCIVGAGITGLNALVVAAQYLSRDDTVILVDSRPRVGGMWVDTYDYVRLHQPHRIFTAGDIAWRPRRPASHLASKTEVLEHLGRCRDVASGRIRLDERLGWAYESHREVDGVVEITLRRPDGRSEVIAARRLIKAFGHRVTPAPPLTLSSSRVESITPETLGAMDRAGAGREPVWIIGGGKTAMDTAHHLVTRAARRDVNLVAGPGTYFARRETFFPTGLARWRQGTRINAVLKETCERFDGTNEVEVARWYQGTYGISPTDNATAFFSAYLSDAESEAIRSGLRTVEREYLRDVVDAAGPQGAELVFRSGRRVRVPSGVWIVNCTGLLVRDRHRYEPAYSASGNVVSIQLTSSLTGPFSAFAGYYLTHLMFLGRLQDARLYELDLEQLATRNRSVAIFASFALSLHNLGRIARVAPPRVMLRCGLDFDRWYPAPRRMLGSLKLLTAQRRLGEQNRRTLDTVAERFGVRCGPIEHSQADSS